MRDFRHLEVEIFVADTERTRRLTQAGYLSDAKASGQLYVQQGVGGGVTDAYVSLDIAYTVQKTAGRAR